MRWIFRALMVVVLFVAVMLGVLFLIPTERIGTMVGEQFERATGRSLAIGGEIRPTLYPRLGVRVGDIELGNPDWVSDGPMLRAERLNVGVSLAALFSGNVAVERFELVRPEIVAVQGADGRVSWDFSGAEATASDPDGAAAEGSSLEGYSLDLAEITDGTLLYRDAATGNEMRINDLDMTMRLPSADGLATLEGGFSMNGARLSLEADIEGLGPLLEGEVRPVTFSASWAGGEAGFNGRAGLTPLGVEGALAFDATDLGPLMALAGQAAPDLPRGLGRDRLAAHGALTLASEGSVHLREGRFIFDQNELSGDIDIATAGERPMIRARLQGGALDLTGLTGGAGGGEASGGTAASGTGWPRDHIDVSALHSADAEVALVLGGLDLGVATLDAVDLRTTLTAGRMVFDLRQIAAYGGAISGEYVINGRGGLSMGGNLSLNSVQLRPLLTEFAGMERLEGTGNANLQFLVVGNDMHTLMNSLSGSGNVSLGQGAILGLDIGGMIRNLDTSYQGEGQRTVYDSITASFTMDGGVATNNDLSLSAPFGQLSGSGTVGIGQQVVDYTAIPQVMAGEGGSGVRVPLRVSGPWSDLSYSLDLEALAQQELDEQVEQLEQRATEAVTEALGVEVQEGQSVEDAVQDSLEERLRNEAESQLLRLLGGN